MAPLSVRIVVVVVPESCETDESDESSNFKTTDASLKTPLVAGRRRLDALPLHPCAPRGPRGTDELLASVDGVRLALRRRLAPARELVVGLLLDRAVRLNLRLELVDELDLVSMPVSHQKYGTRLHQVTPE